MFIIMFGIAQEILSTELDNYSITLIIDMLYYQGIRISEETCRRYLKELNIPHANQLDDWYQLIPSQDINRLMGRVVVNKLRDTF